VGRNNTKKNNDADDYNLVLCYCW